MAAFSAIKIAGLFDRLRSSLSRHNSVDLSDALVARTPLSRIFPTPVATNGQDIDCAWLERRELSSSFEVSAHLESSGFREQPPGLLHALLLDGRFGLIGCEVVGDITSAEPAALARDIMRSASRSHAAGLVLAVRDPLGVFYSARRSDKLALKLFRLGETIEIYMLEFLFLTSKGWKGLLSIRGRNAF